MRNSLLFKSACDISRVIFFINLLEIFMKFERWVLSLDFLQKIHSRLIFIAIFYFIWLPSDAWNTLT